MRQSDNLLKVRADNDHGHTFLGKQRYRVVDLARAPMSIPLVGSSRIKILGDREIHRAMIAFC